MVKPLKDLMRTVLFDRRQLQTSLFEALDSAFAPAQVPEVICHWFPCFGERDLDLSRRVFEAAITEQLGKTSRSQWHLAWPDMTIPQQVAAQR